MSTIPKLTIIIPTENDIISKKNKLEKNKKNENIIENKFGEEWAIYCSLIINKDNRYEELICQLSEYNLELSKLNKKEKELVPPRKAYSYFFKTKRKILGSLISCTKMCGFDIAKFLGKMWRETISPERKESYYSLEKEDQKRFDDELDEIISKRNRIIINIEKTEEMIRRKCY